ncbi:MAG TPA: hypothetical protein VH643_17110 [Gemmataceae bacterium]|jgi:uncharacterized protein YceK
MKTVGIAALAVTAAFLLSGCGTICNLASGDPDIYGGVKKDVTFIQTPNSGGVSGQGGAVILLVLAAETGLSLVADTLTLPLVVRMRRTDPASEDKAQPTGDEARKSRGRENSGADEGIPSSLFPSNLVPNPSLAGSR